MVSSTVTNDPQFSSISLSSVLHALLLFSAFDVLQSDGGSRNSNRQIGFYRDALSIAEELLKSKSSPACFALGTIWCAMKMNVNSKYPYVDSTFGLVRYRAWSVLNPAHNRSSISTNASLRESFHRDCLFIRELTILLPLACRRVAVTLF